jgi:DDE superfamily endonuclease
MRCGDDFATTDVKEENQAYFTSADNGRASNALGLIWLRYLGKDTHHKSRVRRVLIADGHSSHVNWGLLRLADELRILILVLPSHTTRRLQPLDVGSSTPLSTAYGTELNGYMDAGLQRVSITKRTFRPMFPKKCVQYRVLAQKYQKKSYESTGIWPLDKKKLLKKRL